MVADQGLKVRKRAEGRWSKTFVDMMLMALELMEARQGTEVRDLSSLNAQPLELHTSHQWLEAGDLGAPHVEKIQLAQVGASSKGSQALNQNAFMTVELLQTNGASIQVHESVESAEINSLEVGEAA